MSTEADKRLEAFSTVLALRTIWPTVAMPECVYHYTSAAGFSGILCDKAIRATNYSFLNDPSEVIVGRQLVEHEMAAMSHQSDRSVREFLREVSRHLTIETLAEVYVASFTSLPDDLSQWRAYGSTLPERFAIGFNVLALIEQASALPNAMYAKVVYEPQQRAERVRALLEKVAELFLREPPSESEWLVYALVTAAHLVRVMPILKDKSYDREEEWRVVMWHRRGDEEPSIDTSRGFLKPYLPFPLGVNIPIVDVSIMAPTRREQALKAAALLLQAKGIAGVVPHHSEIPFAD
jgi:hypothetical protein